MGNMAVIVERLFKKENLLLMKIKFFLAIFFRMCISCKMFFSIKRFEN